MLAEESIAASAVTVISSVFANLKFHTPLV
jgi:hypothetical protein